jgi:hypothetical protein
MKDESFVPTARNETALAMRRMPSETGTEARYLVHMSWRGELTPRLGLLGTPAGVIA